MTPRTQNDVAPSQGLGSESPPSRLRRLTIRNPYFWAGLMGMFTVTAIRPFLRHEPAPPAVVGNVPSFQLTNQQGLPFGSEQLRGKVYVASFLFTTCPSVCPLIAKSLVELQQRYDKAGAPVQLVSITVDPETDTPEVLKEFGSKWNADFSRWSFLTGPQGQITELIERGFKVAKGEPMNMGGGVHDITHTNRFVLVDGNGEIRGYYGTDASGVDEVYHRSLHVLKEDHVKKQALN